MSLQVDPLVTNAYLAHHSVARWPSHTLPTQLGQGCQRIEVYVICQQRTQLGHMHVSSANAD